MEDLEEHLQFLLSHEAFGKSKGSRGHGRLGRGSCRLHVFSVKAQIERAKELLKSGRNDNEM
jgi:hypothetical protein